MKKELLKWRYYWLIVLIYNGLLPYKIYFGGIGKGWGLIGFVSAMESYPFSFFVFPMLIFLVIRYRNDFLKSINKKYDNLPSLSS